MPVDFCRHLVGKNSGNVCNSDSACRQQGHAVSKTLHQQNPPVLNWTCWLTQVDPYNGCKAVIVVVLLLTNK